MAAHMPATPPPATTKSNVPRSSGSAGRPSRLLRSRKTVSSESSGAHVVQREEDGVATRVESRQIVQRDLVDALRKVGRTARLPMPFGIARTEERVAVAAVDAQAEGAGGMLLLVGPVGRPVLRPHEDAVLAALRNFDLRHGVLDRRTQTVCQEVARPHLLHELGIGRPAALVPEIGSREQYGVARRQLRDAAACSLPASTRSG